MDDMPICYLDDVPACFLCSEPATGAERPIYRVGATRDNWAINDGGDFFYHCANHIIEAYVAAQICQTIGEDIPITGQTIELIQSQTDKFCERHKGKNVALGFIEFKRVSMWGYLAKDLNTFFLESEYCQP